MGSGKVCRLGAFALAVGLAAASVGLAAAQGSPASGLMSIDTPLDGEGIANGDTVWIGGWVVNQGAPNAPVRIQGFLDGPPGSGAFLGNGVHGGPRPDVAAATGRVDWLNSAFGLTWRPTDLRAGDHVVYISANTGGSAIIRTVSVRVTNNPTTRANCSYIMPCLIGQTSLWDEYDTGGPAIHLDYRESPMPGR